MWACKVLHSSTVGFLCSKAPRTINAARSNSDIHVGLGCPNCRDCVNIFGSNPYFIQNSSRSPIHTWCVHAYTYFHCLPPASSHGCRVCLLVSAPVKPRPYFPVAFLMTTHVFSLPAPGALLLPTRPCSAPMVQSRMASWPVLCSSA